MLVAPFNRRIINVVSVQNDFAIGVRQNQPGSAQAISRSITLKEMVAFNDMTTAGHHAKMPEPHRTIVTDFHIIGVAIERDRLAQLRIHRLFV